jgi:hypothetical protein
MDTEMDTEMERVEEDMDWGRMSGWMCQQE